MADGVDGRLLGNLILFGRLLRALGLDVNPGRMIDLVRALAYVDIGRRMDFYHTVRTLLVHDREDLALFDHAFELFWRKPGSSNAVFELAAGRPERSRPEPIVTAPLLSLPDFVLSAPADEDGEEMQPLIEVTRTYSRREQLRRKDFGELSAAELQEVHWLIARMEWQLGLRQTRRLQVGHGRRLDFRRTLRRNLRYGGELLEWPTRRRKQKPRPLIILADISGSMERYTRLLLRFVYSLARGLDQPVETFVFSTRLTRISRQLRSRDVNRALQEVAAEVDDWAGGTRIGLALRRFNVDWGRRVLRRGALVLLISDGWDRGDPDLLRTEIARLRRSSSRLIWLNPLLRHEHYEPLTRGMQAALPHIDDFLPVHNLASLEELAGHLSGLTGRGRSTARRDRPLQGAAFSRDR